MSSKSNGRILIVEDDLLLSMVEERLIQKLGHDVVGKAESGLEALDKVSELNPDVVIMDISLDGDLDGIETVQKIREESDVPVIYLSGSSDRYQYERAQKTGCVEFLTKPITGGDLKEPLSKALNGSVQNKAASAQPLNKTA
ncbi:response regulator [Fodinibius saliphilus]|uniref:response regulator n=1 Tax=Fodinibius saliphilus TaxID=1920650 RepID=UPI0011085081|nr:response regulator [Fodinibius saliphilus]